MKERVILHCDCNSFFASVELLKYPELQNKPVAVSGSVDNRRGIILAKNEGAKKYKIQTAETVWQAKKKCPDLILLPPHKEGYKKYSKIINQIYTEYTDLVEPFGIDESWLDITGSWDLFGDSPEEVADKIRRHVFEKTKLTISVGVSFNKIFAKLGSDYKKPNATTVIGVADYQKIVWPLPVSSLLFVGKKAREKLAQLGITTIGQLANSNVAIIEDILGKLGQQIYSYANGLDDAPVARAGESEPVKSVGNGMTFRRNLIGKKDVRIGIGVLADEVATRLRELNIYTGNIQVIIKDINLKSISRQKKAPYATNLAKDIVEIAMQIIQENWNFKTPIRMITITAQNLTDVPFAVQTSLFDNAVGMNPKRIKLEKSMDLIRGKYGQAAIIEANVLHNDIGIDEKENLDNGENIWNEEE